MVFSPIHYIPSVFSALLIILLAGRVPRTLRSIAWIMASFAVLGLLGYLSRGEFRFYPPDWHVLHSFFGIIALILTLTVFWMECCFINFMDGLTVDWEYIARHFSPSLALSSGLYLLFGLADLQQETLCRNETSRPASRDHGDLSPSRMHPISCRRWKPSNTGKKSDALEPAGNNAIQGNASYQQKHLPACCHGSSRRRI